MRMKNVLWHTKDGLQTITLSRDSSEQHMEIVGTQALSRVKYLSLCRNKLSALPPQIRVMVALVDVRMSDNWLKCLPDVSLFQTRTFVFTGFADRLRSELCHGHMFAPVAQEMRLLTNLESLRVGGNQLATIEHLLPPAIRELKNPTTEEGGIQEEFAKVGPFKTLRTLRFGQNRVSKIPINFAQIFVHLRTLVANKNGLVALPIDLFNLPSLEVLVLSRNELTDLPPVNNAKIRLRCLVLSRNLFEEIPTCIGKIRFMQKLYFDNNKIAALPKALGALKYMYKLNMANNQLTGDSVMHSGLLKSATLHNIILKPGNPNVPKDLSSKENFAASPLASPLRRLAQQSPLNSPEKPPGDDESDYDDPSPRRVDL